MIKDQVIEILYQLGFQPELVDENLGFKFDYEGLTLLFTPEDEDAHTVFFMVPNIFDVTDDNRIAVMEAVVKLAGKMKFVQPTLMSDAVWLNYHHYLAKEEQPSLELIEHMIRVLAASTIQFHKIINNENNDQ